MARQGNQDNHFAKEKLCNECYKPLRMIKVQNQVTDQTVCVGCKPPNGKCPLCGARLRTQMAQQCPKCKCSWHLTVVEQEQKNMNNLDASKERESRGQNKAKTVCEPRPAIENRFVRICGIILSPIALVVAYALISRTVMRSQNIDVEEAKLGIFFTCLLLTVGVAVARYFKTGIFAAAILFSLLFIRNAATPHHETGYFWTFDGVLLVLKSTLISYFVICEITPLIVAAVFPGLVRNKDGVATATAVGKRNGEVETKNTLSFHGSSHPPHQTSISGDISIEINKLLGKGLDLDEEDHLGKTLLHRAVEQGRRDGVELLLNNGADVNSADRLGNTPLHTSVGKGYAGRNLDILKLLLSKGASLSSKNQLGQTPLDIATKTRLETIVQLLRKHDEGNRKVSGPL